MCVGKTTTPPNVVQTNSLPHHYQTYPTQIQPAELGYFATVLVTVTVTVTETAMVMVMVSLLETRAALVVFCGDWTVVVPLVRQAHSVRMGVE